MMANLILCCTFLNLLTSFAFARFNLSGQLNSFEASAWAYDLTDLPLTPSLPGRPAGDTVEVNGAKLWYAEFGNPHSQQTPVILLHGGLGNSDYWGSVIPHLDQSRRIIVMDTRGHGRSTRDNKPLSFDLYASDVTGLLSKLRIRRAAFVGWSHMAVGTIAAMINPQTSRFVERAFLYGGYSNIKANNPNFTKTKIYNQFVTRAQAEYLHYNPQPNLAAFAAAVTKLDETLPVYTSRDLSRIRLGRKVTVAFGKQEEAIKRAEFTNLSNQIKQSRLVLINHATHYGPLQRPQEIAKQINLSLNIQ